MSNQHLSVMLPECLAALNLPEALDIDSQPRYFVDGTYGRGGHSAAMLARLRAQDRLLVIDQDPEAIAHAQTHWGNDPRVIIRAANFSALKSLLEGLDWLGKIDGMLFDLGVSSPQLDQAERGFSFLRDGDLDMRMNPTAGMSAADWLATVEERELARVLWEYGEEKFSRRIARHLVGLRDTTPFVRTAQLAEAIAAVVPKSPDTRRIHPATRSFQAIRIYINQELQVLDSLLRQILLGLKVGGRLAVLSFHSLEDRRVKQFIQAEAAPAGDPLGLREKPPARVKKFKRQAASAAECQVNPRARSAILRAAEKL